MKLATLTRFDSSVQGTFGKLTCEELSLYITELPWRNNEKSKSCIPEGLYKISWSHSPRFGFAYRVHEVPGRSAILIHAGNYAGDTVHKYLSNSYGCMLPALRLGYLNKQKAGLYSVAAVRKLVGFFQKQTFMLEIKNVYNPFITSV